MRKEVKIKILLKQLVKTVHDKVLIKHGLMQREGDESVLEMIERCSPHCV